MSHTQVKDKQHQQASFWPLEAEPDPTRKDHFKCCPPRMYVRDTA